MEQNKNVTLKQNKQGIDTNNIINRPEGAKALHNGTIALQNIPTHHLPHQDDKCANSRY